MNGKNVMIGYNRRDPKSVRIAEEICAELTASGFAPLSLKYDDGGTGGLKGAKSSESGEGCVCMITVGGDGSIISHGKLAAVWGIPLMGVNTGRLGFMANLEPGDIKRIPEIITGNFRVSRRMMMSVDVSYANGGKLHQNCLNDVVVSRDSKSKLPEFCVYCGETEVSRLRADGVIFSTPTGSTAYSECAAVVGGAYNRPCAPLYRIHRSLPALAVFQTHDLLCGARSHAAGEFLSGQPRDDKLRRRQRISFR